MELHEYCIIINTCCHLRGYNRSNREKTGDIRFCDYILQYEY